MESLTITQPDDWHCHLRDNDILHETVPATARSFHRAIVMPNLKPPVTSAELAQAYKQRILEAVPANKTFSPLMVLYLTNSMTTQTIKQAHANGVIAAKLYPAGATTNSADGVNNIEQLYPLFEAMTEVGMLLLIHGEVTDSDIDIFDREKVFIEKYLDNIANAFPQLKIVFEHITTKDAVEFVISTDENIAATITPQHLMLNRNDMLVGGIRPHHYCLPILKRREHQEALRKAVSTGSSKFFLGTDSAPHHTHLKETSCGCAGCYSAPAAIELYTEIFDELNILDKLESFASFYGADFYGLPRNKATITLVKQEWQVPELVKLMDGGTVTPFHAGKTLHWQQQ